MIKSIPIFKVSPKKVAMNAFFSVEIKKIGNLDKFHVWFWATSTRDVQQTYLPGSDMRARVRARCELLNCYGFQNLWSNYCTIHLCSAHTKQHYDYFELTGGGGRWEGGWRRTGGHFSYTSCHLITIVIDHHLCKNPHLWKGFRGGKPYECDQCKYFSKTAQNLKTHRLTHSFVVISVNILPH